MTQIIRVVDYDVIFLSYDEPNAEENYTDLCSKIPWAKRVHGVEGSDAAHKACAELSETDRFITVDADNIIDLNFIEQEIEFKDGTDTSKVVISWCGKNKINGLVYGNGGLKLWPKEYVLNMRTHENADPSNPNAQVDFCWDAHYIQMNTIFSDVMNNATPHQAWRAGFREGVKMALDQGIKPTLKELHSGYWHNLHRLWIWCMVGADVQNGLWAVLGARAGLYKTMCTDWNYHQVRDFQYLNDLWENEYASINESNLLNLCCEYTQELKIKCRAPVASPFDPEQSRFFKTVYQVPPRVKTQPFLITK
jgi:hypothetical protein